MPAAYSRDLRERLLEATDAGHTTAEIARTMHVSESSLRRWRARRRRGEDLTARAIPGRPRLLSAAHEDALVAQVADAPDATLAEHRDRFVAEHGQPVSVWTVGRVLRRRGLPLKKSP